MIVKKMLFAMFLLFSGCADQNYQDAVAFIGDSEVAKWDLQCYFPYLETINSGKGGSGLQYIQEHSGCMQGKKVVVQFGTNDLRRFDNAYADKYIDAVAALDADETYVISMFPRCFKGDAAQVNDVILSMNLSIRQRAESQGWVYVDVFPLLKTDDDINWNYYTDGLHLNEDGYELISDELRKYLK